MTPLKKIFVGFVAVAGTVFAVLFLMSTTFPNWVLPDWVLNIEFRSIMGVAIGFGIGFAYTAYQKMQSRLEHLERKIQELQGDSNVDVE